MALGVDGADDGAAVAEAAHGFEQLESRLRPVGTVDGVLFVDDSLSTNVLPTLAAVDAFPGRRVAVIVGGQDRGIDYGPLAEGLAARPAPTLVAVTASEAAPIQAAFDAGPAGREGRGLRRREVHGGGFDWARPDGVVLLSPAAPASTASATTASGRPPSCPPCTTAADVPRSLSPRPSRRRGGPCPRATSSTWVATLQWWPNGSSNWPEQSP